MWPWQVWVCSRLRDRARTLAASGGIPVIGLLTLSLDAQRTEAIEALKQGLRDLGYVEGRTLTIETRHAEGDATRLPALAGELIARDVALLVASATPEAQAAHDVTQAVPLVMMNVGDPVALGFVASLNQPGGNMTGLTNLSRQVVPKGLELLHEISPGPRSHRGPLQPDRRVEAGRAERPPGGGRPRPASRRSAVRGPLC